MALKIPSTSYQRCPSPEPYSSYSHHGMQQQSMDRRYGVWLRAIFALFWLSTAAFIAVVVILNVAGISVEAHNSAHIASSGQTNGGGDENINFNSLAVLSFYYYTNSDESITFTWYPNAILAHNASSSLNPTSRIWTGPGGSPSASISSYLANTAFQTATFSFSWPNNLAPLVLHAISLLCALPPLLLLPFLIFRSSSAYHRSLAIWTGCFGVAAAGFAIVAGALLTWHACNTQTQLYEAFGVVLVSKVGRGLLGCLWLVPGLIGSAACVVLMVVLWTGKYENEDAMSSTDARWYAGRRQSTQDAEIPPPYELINAPYNSRK